MMMFTSGPLHCRSTVTSGGLHRLPSLQIQPQHYNRGNVKLPYADIGLKLNATSKYRTQGVEGETRSGDVKVIKRIQSMLESMEDGEISFSAYDTAWVAMIRDVRGSDTPQFPSSLEWISNNQLSDGSWGCDHLFSAYDRLISTLACVVALKTWNVHPIKCQKGIDFVQQNLNKLEKEKSQNMTCGFELIFPSMLELARGAGIKLAFDSPVIETIHAKRKEKLKRIPRDTMHKMPTTLLYSLEALEGIGLNWEQILSLKCKNGSLLNSPSSTAYAFMRTKDENCLQYLTHIVHKFNGPDIGKSKELARPETVMFQILMSLAWLLGF